jgi:signal transduction histidine kinase
LTEFRRLLRIGGLLTLLMVCVPVLLNRGLDLRRFVPWVLVVFLFASAFWHSSGGARPVRLFPLLALEAACVMGMVLLLCDGFEGALLVLVALQLGGRAPRRLGVAWIVAQSLLLGAAVAIHWAPRPALLLASPYLGFQLLAFFVADVLARDAAARGLAEENSRLGERLRIARELHDVVGHRLTALSLNLEAASRMAQGSSRDPLVSAHGLAKAALSDIRSVVAQLRDPERMNLSEALRTLAAEMPQPLVHLSVPASLCQNDPDRALTLLRCTQEIITNAARHAMATNLWIEISEAGGCIELRARDDGCGTGEVRAGNGLRGMRERVERAGGQLEISTTSGLGFAIRATFPAATRMAS